MEAALVALAVACLVLLVTCCAQHRLIRQLRHENIKTYRERTYWHDRCQEAGTQTMTYNGPVTMVAKRSQILIPDEACDG